jgi:hypothetical protein
MQPLGAQRVIAPAKSIRRKTMTAHQYLLRQAEFCRRTASQSPDPYIAEELYKLAKQFELNAERAADKLANNTARIEVDAV